MSFLDTLFDPVLQPLINFSPFWGIVILGVGIAFLSTIAYKYLTDQRKMKDLKEKQKEYQKRMKELRSDPQKMMEVQKEAMKSNMEYMKMSFKPTLFTMIPLLLLVGWMAGHLTFEPIYPQETYSMTAIFKEGVTGTAEIVPSVGTEVLNDASQAITGGAVTWNLRSTEGEHTLAVKLGAQEESRNVLITKELRYADPLHVSEHSDIEKLLINYKPLKPLGTTNIFGWHPGWLGLYFIFSLIGSLAFRKLLKIY
ncbi:TMCO1/EMC3 family protein [Candidatus Woesearchaeota archaeon]|nr:TMCO1/EMC3 family protein [Candidatus Woesearchaeota archaeon]